MKSSLEQAFQDAAHTADRAVSAAMLKYSNGLVTDEDDITGVLIGQLDAAFDDEIFYRTASFHAGILEHLSADDE